MSRRLGLWFALLSAGALPACAGPAASAGGSSAGSGGLSDASSGDGGSQANSGGSARAGAEGLAPTAGGGGATGGGGAASSEGGRENGGGRDAGGGAGTGGNTDRCDVANYAAAAPPRILSLTGNLGTHDPMILGADGKFFLFSTGDNIGAKTSSDLSSWQGAPEVLGATTRPAWLAQQVPGVDNLWAPDASYFGEAYHLYYSASTFGSNRSCIGHLARASLSAGSWSDRGPVICSNTSSTDDYNAIDPNVIIDATGTPWLSFGSFWSGIKLIKLDLTGARDGGSLEALAARPGVGGALEAPFMVRRCGFYYLFTSWDRCCQGVDSTYNIRVGRASAVSGPFVDRAGKALLQGGGTLVLQGDARYHGPGHNAVLFTTSGAYNVYHAYDVNNDGAPVLRIAELSWDSEGWPVSAGP